ncbi:response regulator [Sulfitobacter sp. M57]|uniref:response regulator n=1 Tax=unclassified Sulfitobacter TaxID=196795 RepID=UPI0023E30654|nr:MULTISPECIES: response regulator [unclassified Sulfitobacter]MDF3414575.1 response regulator [Sulfitobacter sp. KE5]MDF3422056.1 response regulator [Sulfitobacter sp. KE43]MDF3433121.1 response regulator [Sulfitobacter sp. KE42]MDF3458761.1 response regulator [Sulfitobacter sp. S74]MDF3462661.1 response regulator [Sulfitobacter sp. Ks18]
MDTINPFAANIPVPTSARPLLGLTVLVVEDSRFACEALRLLCLQSGARIRRADCLRSARRHFRVYRPSVVLIDLGLPDGNGSDLIAELHEAVPRVDGILAISGDPQLAEAALAAGADGFMEKPILSIGGFQEKILGLLPPERRPKGPRQVDNTDVAPDRLAYQDDMAHIADVLDEGLDDHTLDYIAQFLSGLARSADDPVLENAARALARKRAMGKTAASETAQIAGIIQTRLAEKLAI